MRTLRSHLRKITAGVSILALLFATSFSFISDTTFGQGTPTATITPSTVLASVGTLVSLSATNSTTTAGGAFNAGPPANLTFGWAMTTPGGAAILSSFTASNVVFTPDVPGPYTIQLIVTDTVTSTTNQTQVVVNAVAGNPTAQIGASSTTPNVGTLVTLNGTSSTTAGGSAYSAGPPANLTFGWAMTTPGGVANLSSTTTDTVTFTPDVAGAYTIQLIVTDPLTSTNNQTQLVINAQPVAVATPTAILGASSLNPNVGTLVTVNATGSTTAAGGAYTAGPPANITFGWAMTTPGGASILSAFTGDTVTFTPDVNGAYVIQVIATDALTSTTHQTSITVTANGGPATPTANLGFSPNAPTVGQTVTLQTTASTTASGAAYNAGPPANLTFGWAMTTPGGASILSAFTGDTVTFIPDVAGNYVIQVIATDPSNASTHQTQVTVSVGVIGGGGNGGGNNAPPTAVLNFTQSPASGAVPNTVSFDATGSFGIGIIQYEWDFNGDGIYDTALSTDPKATTTYTEPTSTQALLRVTDLGNNLTTVLSAYIPLGAGVTGGGGSIFKNFDFPNVGGGSQPDGVSGIILEKEVSVNGADFAKADTEAQALSLGIRKSSQVTYRVRLQNLTGVGIKKMVLEDAFHGDKLVRQSNIGNVTGATYDAKLGQFTVDKAFGNGESMSFTYTASLVSSSRNATAYNTIKIADYEFKDTAAPRKGDIGLADSAYVQFGRRTVAENITSGVNQFIPTSLSSDVSEASSGDTVNYSVNVSNNSDAVLTGVSVHVNYGSQLLEVTQAEGAENTGEELVWNFESLEVGETVLLSYAIRVRDAAEREDTMVTATVTVYSNEYDEQAIGTNELKINPRFAGFLAGAQRTLPKTGLALALPLLGALGLATTTRRRKKYSNL
jgi:hypothetical protein